MSRKTTKLILGNRWNAENIYKNFQIILGIIWENVNVSEILVKKIRNYFKEILERIR